MAKSPPVVYLLHGEDEFAITEFIRKLQEKMGDSTTAEMNTTRLDGGALQLEELRAAASAIPFLASRRLVIVARATQKITDKSEQDKFMQILDSLPASTALVLTETKTLTEKHWLLRWAEQAGERAYVKAYSLPEGAGMATWIRKQATERGGEFTPPAAALLGELVGSDPRLATQEIEKLLAYANYQRPVDVDDVNQLAASATGGGDFFALVDSLAASNARRGMDMLNRLLDEQDALQLFFGLVGHFRLLLQTRELAEAGGTESSVAQELGIHPFRAKKLFAQARTLNLGVLETIYRRLLDYDHEIKTGRIDADLALETLVAALTAQAA